MLSVMLYCIEFAVGVKDYVYHCLSSSVWILLAQMLRSNYSKTYSSSCMTQYVYLEDSYETNLCIKLKVEILYTIY